MEGQRTKDTARLQGGGEKPVTYLPQYFWKGPKDGSRPEAASRPHSGWLAPLEASVCQRMAAAPQAGAWPGLEDESRLAGAPTQVPSLGWGCSSGDVWIGLRPVDHFVVEGTFSGTSRQELDRM